MNVKKKGGLIKGGLKYISHIFEEDEPQQEIQIGAPTDVKHVAHIGCDGPSAQPPSWMDEFRSQNGGYTSAPLDGCAKGQTDREDGISEDKSVGKREAPKTSRRHVSMDNIDMMESPVGSPGSNRAAKSKTKDPNKINRRRKEKPNRQKEASSAPSDEASSQDVPNIPKKHRRKKSKDLDAIGKAGPKRNTKKGSTHGSNRGSDDPNSGLDALEDE